MADEYPAPVDDVDDLAVADGEEIPPSEEEITQDREPYEAD